MITITLTKEQAESFLTKTSRGVPDVVVGMVICEQIKSQLEKKEGAEARFVHWTPRWDGLTACRKGEKTDVMIPAVDPSVVTCPACLARFTSSARAEEYWECPQCHSMNNSDSVQCRNYNHPASPCRGDRPTPPTQPAAKGKWFDERPKNEYLNLHDIKTVGDLKEIIDAERSGAIKEYQEKLVKELLDEGLRNSAEFITNRA